MYALLEVLGIGSCARARFVPDVSWQENQEKLSRHPPVPVMCEVVLAAQVEPEEGVEPAPGGRVLPGTVSCNSRLHLSKEIFFHMMFGQ